MSTEPTARLTPYELVFGAEAIDDRLFPPIAEEAEAREVPLDDPDRFLFLSSVGRLLQSIAGDGEGSEEARKEEIRQYGRLLYHAFHLWQERKPLLLLDTDAARWLMDDVTRIGDWRLRPPASSGYVQLPRHLAWAAPATGMTPEPVDGFFWTFVAYDDAPDRLHVLLALGLRPDRPGLSIVPVTGVLDSVDHWADADARPAGTDFETTLPGGEQDRLYSLETPEEMLKLASLVFWHLDSSPESISREQRAGPEAGSHADGESTSVEDIGFEARTDEGAPVHPMPPSALPYRTIRRSG